MKVKPMWTMTFRVEDKSIVEKIKKDIKKNKKKMSVMLFDSWCTENEYTIWSDLEFMATKFPKEGIEIINLELVY